MAQTTVIEEGAEKIREALESFETEAKRVRKDLSARRTKLEKRFKKQRTELEKRAKKLRNQIEKNPTVKRLESFRKDTQEQVEQRVNDVLDSLSIASKSDVKRIDRKISQLNRKLREMEKAG